MRMVSNKHLSAATIKRFRRVFVQRKQFTAPAPIQSSQNKKEEDRKEDNKKIEAVAEEPVFEPIIEVSGLTAEQPVKPKSRKKKTTTATENKTENEESHE